MSLKVGRLHNFYPMMCADEFHSSKKTRYISEFTQQVFLLKDYTGVSGLFRKINKKNITLVVRDDKTDTIKKVNISLKSFLRMTGIDIAHREQVYDILSQYDFNESVSQLYDQNFLPKIESSLEYQEDLQGTVFQKLSEQAGLVYLPGMESKFSKIQIEKLSDGSKIEGIDFKSYVKGGFNHVKIFWDNSRDDLQILRVVSNPQNNSKIESFFKKYQFFYEKLPLSTSRNVFFDPPGELVAFEEKIGILKPFAVHKSLRENQGLFLETPRALVLPLLCQLKAFLENNFGMGDVKASNVLIYDHEGIPTPVYSDFDGSLFYDIFCDDFEDLVTKFQTAYPDESSESIVNNMLFYWENPTLDSKQISERGFKFREIAQLLQSICCIIGTKQSNLRNQFSFSENYQNSKRVLLQELSSYLVTGIIDNFHQSCFFILRDVQQRDVRATAKMILETLLPDKKEMIQTVFEDGWNSIEQRVFFEEAICDYNHVKGFKDPLRQEEIAFLLDALALDIQINDDFMTRLTSLVMSPA